MLGLQLAQSKVRVPRSSGRGVKMYIEIRPTLMFASGILRLLFILCAVTHWAACAWFCDSTGSCDPAVHGTRLGSLVLRGLRAKSLDSRYCYPFLPMRVYEQEATGSHSYERARPKRCAFETRSHRNVRQHGACFKSFSPRRVGRFNTFSRYLLGAS